MTRSRKEDEVWLTDFTLEKIVMSNISIAISLSSYYLSLLFIGYVTRMEQR